MTSSPPPDASVVVRSAPSSRKWLGRQGRTALVVYAAIELLVVASVVLDVVRLPALRIPGVIYAAVVTVLATAGGLYVRRRVRQRMFLFAAPDAVGYSGVRGRLRVVPRSSLRSIRRVCGLMFTRARSAQFHARYLLFLGADDLCLLRVQVDNFAAEDVERFLSSAGVMLDGSWADVSTLRDLRRRFPRSFPWAQAHVTLVAVLAGVVPSFVVIAVVLLARHFG